MTVMSEKSFKKASKSLFDEVGTGLGITYAQSMQLLSKVLFSVSYEEAKATVLKERCRRESGVDKQEGESVVVIKSGEGDEHGDVFISGRYLPEYRLADVLPDLVFTIPKNLPISSKEIFVKLGFDDIESSLLANIIKKNYGFVRFNGFDYSFDEFKSGWPDVMFSCISECGLSFDESIDASVVYISGGAVGGDPEKTICLSLSDLVGSKKIGLGKWIIVTNYLEDEICGIANVDNRITIKVDV